MNSPLSSSTYVTASSAQISSCVPPLLLTSSSIRQAYFDFRDDISTPPSSPPPHHSPDVCIGPPTDEQWGLPPAVDMAWEQVTPHLKPLVTCLCDSPAALVAAGQKFTPFATALAHYLNICRAQGGARCVFIISRTEATASAWVDILDPLLDEIKLTRLRTAKTKREAAFNDLQNLRAPGVFVANEKLLLGPSAAIGIHALRDALRQNVHGLRCDLVVSDVARGDALNEEHSPFRMLIDRQVDRAVIAVLDDQRKKSKFGLTKADIESFISHNSKRLQGHDWDINKVWMTPKRILECAAKKSRDMNDDMDCVENDENDIVRPTSSRYIDMDVVEKSEKKTKTVLHASDAANVTVQSKSHSARERGKRDRKSKSSVADDTHISSEAKVDGKRHVREVERRRVRVGRASNGDSAFCPDPTSSAKELVERLKTIASNSEGGGDEGKRTGQVSPTRGNPESLDIESRNMRSSHRRKCELKTGQSSSMSIPNAQPYAAPKPSAHGKVSRDDTKTTRKETRKRSKRQASQVSTGVSKATPEKPRNPRAHWIRSDGAEKFGTPPNSCKDIPEAWEKNYAPTMLKPQSREAQSNWSSRVKRGKEKSTKVLNRVQRSKSTHSIKSTAGQTGAQFRNMALRKTRSERGFRTRHRPSENTSNELAPSSVDRESSGRMTSQAQQTTRHQSKDKRNSSLPRRYSHGRSADNTKTSMRNRRNSFTAHLDNSRVNDGSDVEVVSELKSTQRASHVMLGESLEQIEHDVIVISSDEDNHPNPHRMRPSGMKGTSGGNQAIISGSPWTARKQRGNESLVQRKGRDPGATASTSDGRSSSSRRRSKKGRAAGSAIATAPTEPATKTGGKFVKPIGLDSQKRKKYNEILGRARQLERRGPKFFNAALQLYLECANISGHDEAVNSRIMALASAAGVLSERDFVQRKTPASPIQKKRQATRGRLAEGRRSRSRKSVEDDVIDLTND